MPAGFSDARLSLLGRRLCFCRCVAQRNLSSQQRGRTLGRWSCVESPMKSPLMRRSSGKQPASTAGVLWCRAVPPPAAGARSDAGCWQQRGDMDGIPVVMEGCGIPVVMERCPLPDGAAAPPPVAQRCHFHAVVSRLCNGSLKALIKNPALPSARAGNKGRREGLEQAAVCQRCQQQLPQPCEALGCSRSLGAAGTPPAHSSQHGEVCVGLSPV